MITETGPSLARVVLQVVEQTVATGGATVHRHGEPVPTTGYMVARPWYAETHEYRDGWAVDLAEWIDSCSDILREPDYFIGTWVSGDKIHFDVSAHISDKARAQAVGVAHDQLSILDLEKQSVIFLP